MKPELKEYINGAVVGAVLGTVGFFFVQNLVKDAPPPPDLIYTTSNYLPDDVGEKSILWWQPQPDGTLKLRWEKHATLQWPAAQVPTLSCPIKGACTASAVTPLKGIPTASDVITAHSGKVSVD